MKAVTATLWALALAGCEALGAGETGEACVEAGLVGQCPVGSNPVLGAQAEAACGGSFELKVIEEAGAATGQCQSAGSCEVLCQYESPCSCGVAELSRDRILCAECPSQSCGDGRCEGTERPSCEPGAEACFPCVEDCGGATCGDGDCTGTETPETCPQDCAATCQPNEASCLGTLARVCAADGSGWQEVDCALGGNLCAAGACVAPEVCTPGERRCVGSLLQVCEDGGARLDEIDCAHQGMTCGKGTCVPPNECGNGACEAGELGSCAADCQEECGNGFCAESEDFNSCAQDCPPVCGDGLCSGLETAQSCPGDCLSTCGNGLCDPLETRESCGKDCGWCGNGVCEDGFETPADKPADGLESCPVDCIKLTCSDASECDDGIGCTVAACEGGACVYTPSDAGCGQGEACLGAAATVASGCCADADGDGFAALACGGSDCDDGDGEVHPGAFEVCGGVDANCNGSNAPALSEPLVLTGDLSPKAQLVVHRAAGVYFMAWIGNPAGAEAVEFAVADGSGNLLAGPTTLWVQPEHPPTQLAVSFSPESAVFGVAWAHLADDGFNRDLWLNTVAPDGTIQREAPLFVGHLTESQHGVYLGWRDGAFAVVTDQRFYDWFAGNQCWHHRPTVAWVPDPTATIYGGFGTDPTIPLEHPEEALGMAPMSLVEVGEGFGSVLARSGWGNPSCKPPALGALHSFSSGSIADGYALLSEAAKIDPAGRVAWDGATYVVLTPHYQGGLWYQRIAPSGIPVVQEDLGDGLSAQDVVFAPDIEPSPELTVPAVGGLVGSGNELFMFVRDSQGQPALPMGKIASGSQLERGHLFWDGSRFVAVYLGLSGGLPQVHMTGVSCQ